ncbi:hypothetical protein LEP1GSC082_2601 [Leptospira kirschneri str. H2]|uniref:Uncharacterized protein n=1 Tax=Leptospira kirschneri serovar Bulgarica str. Nikolaevo TaxID=1240687 RepID=M6FPH4_9LEPT|nr:hypothetical protein LEP1GSC082_2601 [Leptospira kirschneri str. H2]EMK02704.1 hypothetical protein LEP1GSC166_3944 [Leptospira kirschneri]EMK24626.1 hypothetical protein LEP1GSC008_4070 [Leptospira kirschneri serovar Bulgarica str. Nikolaevo]
MRIISVISVFHQDLSSNRRNETLVSLAFIEMKHFSSKKMWELIQS